jgi:hypothetical protein
MGHELNRVTAPAAFETKPSAASAQWIPIVRGTPDTLVASTDNLDPFAIYFE